MTALAIVATAGACRTWQPTTLSPDRVIAEERPERIRVTVPGGGQMTLRNPLFVNDSIVAAIAPNPQSPFAVARPGVPITAVEGLEIARFSRARTIALGLGIAALSIGWARIAGSSNAGEPPPIDPVPKGILPRASDGIGFVWRLRRFP